MNPDTTADPRRQDGGLPAGPSRLYLWLGLGAALLAAAAAAWMLLPVTDWLKAIATWIDGLGHWSGAVYVGFYVVAAVLFAPGALLSAGAGFAFGLWGFFVAIAGATLGAAAAFLVARYLARDRIGARIQRHRHFRAIDRAIEDEGWKVVLLLRFSPMMPYNVANYLFGATRIGFRQHLGATFLGAMPNTLMFVYLGAAGHSALSRSGEDGGALQWGMFGFGLVATVAATVLVTRAARKRLSRRGMSKG